MENLNYFTTLAVQVTQIFNTVSIYFVRENCTQNGREKREGKTAKSIKN